MPKQKKNFAGKNKTSKDYDADWVFVKNRGKQPGGVWMTKKQRKIAHYKHQAALAENQAAAAPAAPAGPATVPVPGVPGAPVPVPVPGGTEGKTKWPWPGPSGPQLPVPMPWPGKKTKNPGDSGPWEGDWPIPQVPGQDNAPPPYGQNPSWWKSIAYNNADPNQAFANAANMLIPLLSPEDQASMANYLATNYKDVFGDYANAQFGPIPTTLGEAERKAFLSPQRAQKAMKLLDNMKAATGNKDMGSGFEFLRNAVGIIANYAGTGPMTREQYDQFSNAVAAFTSTATGDQKAWANLAQMFNLPGFSAGPLVSNEANKKLFA